MSDQFIGEIRIFPFNFAPSGWAFAAGQLLPINQNTALFALLGTTYGGNGTTNFALPDLRGRVPINMGSGSGLSPYTLGQLGGTESTTLTVTQLPSHGHPVQSSDGGATTGRSVGAVLARTGTNTYAASPDGSTMNASMIGNTGSNQPVNKVQPFLALNFCIALTGIFPSRG
ncbi:MAG: tail fiber protein [Acidimicrobiaceae bacterium]|nr:tail fiber protein [Acidimicrobiaceae bacterium]